MKELLKAYGRAKVSCFEQLLEVTTKSEEHMLAVVKRLSTPSVGEGESSAAALTSLLQDRYGEALSRKMKGCRESGPASSDNYCIARLVYPRVRQNVPPIIWSASRLLTRIRELQTSNLARLVFVSMRWYTP